MATMQLAAGLLAAGGPSRNPTNLGMGLLGGLNQYQDVMDSAAKKKLLEEEMGLRRDESGLRRDEMGMRRDRAAMDMAEARRQQQEREQALARQEQAVQWIDTNRPDLSALARMNLPEAIKRAFPDQKGPLVTKPGDVLRDPTDPTKVIAQNEPTPEAQPELLKLQSALAALPPGDPRRLSIEQRIRTISSHAPAAATNVFTGQMVPAEQGGRPVFVMPGKDGRVSVVEGLQPPGSSKKEQEAGKALQLVDEAERLLPKATGSALGTGIDLTAGVAGISTQGAQAAQQLRVIQGALMMSMPRMEGPQSDKDTQLYREAAGQIGNSMIPIETRRAALQTIRRLNEKYTGGSGAAPAPRRLKYNPETGQLE
jgi:hypothetical protein